MKCLKYALLGMFFTLGGLVAFGGIMMGLSWAADTTVQVLSLPHRFGFIVFFLYACAILGGIVGALCCRSES